LKENDYTTKWYLFVVTYLEVFKMYEKIKSLDQQRVELNKQMLNHLLKRVSAGMISELSNNMGLPYGLVYNIMHGRIKSLSTENYKLIFGEEPPYQALKRVDGAYFRQMVRLWVYLNGDVTEADLYREFYKGKKFKKVDYRIFSGVTKTVDKNLEKIMEQKFFDQGLTRSEIKELVKHFDSNGKEERVFYKQIKPVLDYLKKTLKINPTLILNQWVLRYESGELKTVPKKVYDDALKLKKRTQNAVSSGSKFEIEKIREEIYGQRKGLTLFSEMEEELEFLKKYGGKSLGQYLGRSISYYKKSKLKRIASWRAHKIKTACSDVINNSPDLFLTALPQFHARIRIKNLLSVLKSYSIEKFIKNDDETERHILTPEYISEEKYKNDKYAVIPMDKTAYFLGMSKIAFDLLVAEHSDIFRRIGTYNKEWYLPCQYLKNLKEKEGFNLIKAKYERLSRDYEKSHH
jgi:hypothetical protein